MPRLTTVCRLVTRLQDRHTLAKPCEATPTLTEERVQGTTLRSVRYALGPSFGSLALGSAILTAVQIARQIVEVRMYCMSVYRVGSLQQHMAVDIHSCEVSNIGHSCELSNIGQQLQL